MLELLNQPTHQQQNRDWLAFAQSLGQQFSPSEQAADANDTFVAENFEILRQSGLSAMGVPQEFGGGGASYTEVCETLKTLARHCSSTALAFSMHTHQVMVPAWKWQHQNAPVDGLLKRIAQEKIILLSSGGGDWLPGSGTATRTEGGFLITARKAFASGAPAGDLLMTSAVYDDPAEGKTVLHFALPMQTPGVSIVPTWQAMGMRGTGSHDIVLANVFVSDQAIALRRPADKWHPAFHLITMIAFPIIYSVYVGVAEAARDLVVQHISNCDDEHIYYQVGGLDNELTAAKIALQHMISTSISSQPGFDITNQIMTGRALVARSVLGVVDMAMEIAGGRSFNRPFGLEKLFRDAQGVRFHPLRDEAQRKLSGQLALGYDRTLL
ncbi:MULTISPECIES: acyl-CoA dehydrogenase family protein [Cyanophyceae]|uniref:Dibenzothiophene monooxygenase n=1 Tax=Leptolyngbya subtilissima DQ-A4 TaxID=2933933 RepID=A0ABV0KAL4_9CYAN|nr:acyl-CoA dehydrogenase family protein [Nodosilinea sp. FACHB-141]MBD2113779.1 acyl-CoA dehydrogenase family protein [Nodosilinea sp. FACHB-141]